MTSMAESRLNAWTSPLIVIQFIQGSGYARLLEAVHFFHPQRYPAWPEGGIEMRVRVVLEPSDEGGFTVYVPSLPGCISEGETVDQALANIREAIELYLEPVEDSGI